MPVNVFLPQVTRIPVTGPEPYNTLVCVRAISHGAGEYRQGKLFRNAVTVSTPFKLAGFDQRNPPQFEHSTTAWLSAIGFIENSQWLDAVDTVTGAGFDPVSGLYYVNIEFALLETETVSQQCIQYSENFGICFHPLTIQVSSYVLCYEPPVETKSGRYFYDQLIKPFDHASLTLQSRIGQALNLGAIRSSPDRRQKQCDCNRHNE